MTRTPTTSWDVQTMTERAAHEVGAWRYSGPRSIYDLPSAQPLLDDLGNYFAITSGDRLAGFCCVGDAARVPGVSAEPGIVDVGLGMAPELIGRGDGVAFGHAVLAYLVEMHPGQRFRAVVQDWNEPSRRLTRRLGFEDAGELTVVQDGQPVSYRIVERPTTN